MKHICSLIFSFLTSVIIAQTISTSGMCKDISDLEKDAWIKTHSSKDAAALNNYDITYHRCFWEIDPAVNYIKGNITTFFKPKSSNFSQLEFDLSTNLTVDSVTYHTSSLPFTQLAGDLLQINLPTALPINTLDSLTVFYKGIPNGGSGFGSFVQTKHNGVPIIWTLSEPFGAKTWWPCKQNLADKIDSIDIRVKTPQVNRVASNGLLLSEITSGNDKIYHWKTRYPISTYLVAIAVTNYVFYSDLVPLQTGSLEVLNYVYPEDLDAVKAATQDIINIIKLYDSLLIEYPFAKEKYGHAQFSWSGGMEHQTMSFMGGFSLSLMAHECAHQWFGDYITCGSWEDVWLHEGFASYFEWLVTERYYNSSWTSGLQSIVKSITSQTGGSVMCDDTLLVARIFDSRLSYTKGAFLLRMLRWKLGDASFFNALKNYLNDPALKNGYAKTPQLIAHLESASGQNLDKFFNQWYYKQGYPSYTVSWSQNGSVLSTTITQTQSDSSVSFFEMPVPVKFEARGRDTILIFNHVYSGQVFNTTLDFQVVAARFDPDLRLISANNEVVNPGDQIISKIDIRLFPNPTDENITVQGLPKGTNINEIKITDAFGKTVYLNKGNYIMTDQLLLPTEILRGGVYSILIRTGIGSVALKFIKE